MKPKSAALLKADYLASGCAQAHILFSWNHYYHAAANPEYAAYEHDFSDLCVSMYGDINADGSFQAADAAALCTWLSGNPMHPQNWKAGDLDGDCQLTAADLSLMKRVILRT
jgi:hypothetical protein